MITMADNGCAPLAQLLSVSSSGSLKLTFSLLEALKFQHNMRRDFLGGISHTVVVPPHAMTKTHLRSPNLSKWADFPLALHSSLTLTPSFCSTSPCSAKLFGLAV